MAGVNFRTDDGIVHSQAPLRDDRNFDGTLCGLRVYERVSFIPMWPDEEKHATATLEPTTCALCLGS